MTITSPRPQLAVESPALNAVGVDWYRDIHKGIRNELFALTFRIGNVDPANDAALVAAESRVGNLVHLLLGHAEHEDTFCQPHLEEHVPQFAEIVARDHAILDEEMIGLNALAAEAADDARPDDRRRAVHRLYLGLASFTAAYLGHQAFEEVEVMPALSAVMGQDTLAAVEGAIIASIPPEEMAVALPLMLPAMNIDDRYETLAGMRLGAPPEVFAGVCGMAAAVLQPEDYRALADRLGIA